MKIALLGYGRMGKTIEKLAIADGHEIVYKTSDPIDTNQLKKADVAIDFSISESAFENITTCFREGIPVVSGTTGWLEDYDKAIGVCKKENGSFIYASNFSIGMNLFFELNRTMAKMMKNFDSYKLSIEEIHHTGKRDQPSGTAISLAEDIIEETDKSNWKLIESDQAVNDYPATEIPIEAIREEDVKGTHTIRYTSDIDSMELKHTAFTRDGFAKGAILAAEFLQDKKGIFSMKDVLKDLI